MESPNLPAFSFATASLTRWAAYNSIFLNLDACAAWACCFGTPCASGIRHGIGVPADRHLCQLSSTRLRSSGRFVRPSGGGHRLPDVGLDGLLAHVLHLEYFDVPHPLSRPFEQPPGVAQGGPLPEGEVDVVGASIDTADVLLRDEVPYLRPPHPLLELRKGALDDTSQPVDGLLVGGALLPDERLDLFPSPRASPFGEARAPPGLGL